MREKVRGAEKVRGTEKVRGAENPPIGRKPAIAGVAAATEAARAIIMGIRMMLSPYNWQTTLSLAFVGEPGLLDPWNYGALLLALTC